MKHLTFLLLSGGLLATPALAHEGAAHAAASQAANAEAPAPKLQAALRGLWHGHVLHTRDYRTAEQAILDRSNREGEGWKGVSADATRGG